MISVEQQVIEDMQRRISLTIHTLKDPHPTGQQMSEQTLFNQLEIMKFLLYIRTGIRQE